MKYRATPTVVNGIKFDSAAEASRYRELLMLEQAGEIANLQVHPKWVLQPAFAAHGKRERAITYEADFAYIENGCLIAEDVKPAWENRKDGAWRVFRLKAKMLAYVHGIEVRVIKR